MALPASSSCPPLPVRLGLPRRAHERADYFPITPSPFCVSENAAMERIPSPLHSARDDQFLAPTRTAPSGTRPADVFPAALAYRHDPLRAIRSDAPVSHAIAWDRAMLFRKVRTAVAPDVTAALPVQWQQSDASK